MNTQTETGPTIILKAQNLSKSFGRGSTVVHAVRDVDIEITHGELVAIVGASGSGKTTLLHLLAGMERPDEGTIKVLDDSFFPNRESEIIRIQRENIGVVFQSFNLLPTLSAVDNAAMPLLLAGVSRRDSRETACRQLKLLDLGERLQHRPAQLSGGEQQRVAIARALVTNPKIVLADEPTGSLDSKNSETITGIFREQVATNDRAVILVTHDRKIAACADRVIVLNDGVISHHFTGSEYDSSAV
ncbi:MAG: ABC transporter ATP-binding protein [Planctomycetota bacterium]